MKTLISLIILSVSFQAISSEIISQLRGSPFSTTFTFYTNEPLSMLNESNSSEVCFNGSVYEAAQIINQMASNDGVVRVSSLSDAEFHPKAYVLKVIGDEEKIILKVKAKDFLESYTLNRTIKNCYLL